jgi:hypothetical protein
MRHGCDLHLSHLANHKMDNGEIGIHHAGMTDFPPNIYYLMV